MSIRWKEIESLIERRDAGTNAEFHLGELLRNSFYLKDFGSGPSFVMGYPDGGPEPGRRPTLVVIFDKARYSAEDTRMFRQIADVLEHFEMWKQGELDDPVPKNLCTPITN